ncbi:hypothetical protein J6590_044455 [Homalodisca vitripennis]|nr:hypothetical protein J6590_044455 [Homalodisca vitripennis]
MRYTQRERERVFNEKLNPNIGSLGEPLYAGLWCRPARDFTIGTEIETKKSRHYHNNSVAASRQVTLHFHNRLATTNCHHRKLKLSEALLRGRRERFFHPGILSYRTFTVTRMINRQKRQASSSRFYLLGTWKASHLQHRSGMAVRNSQACINLFLSKLQQQFNQFTCHDHQTKEYIFGYGFRIAIYFAYEGEAWTYSSVMKYLIRELRNMFCNNYGQVRASCFDIITVTLSESAAL